MGIGEAMKSYLGLICLIIQSAILVERGLQCAAITVIPNATAILINDSTYFNCSTTSETVEWLFISDEYLHQSVIYSYGSVKPLYQDRFRVEKYTNSIDKKFNLILQSVSKDDHGRYICRDPDIRNEEGEAQLIVLETAPVCESNSNVDELIGPNSCAIKPTIVQLSCSVRYIGNQVPELQWTKADENIAINSSICLTSGNIRTCNLTMESELQMEGSSYVCQTRTRKYNCTSGVFRIIYALSQPKQLNKTERDIVTCSIQSNSPLCSYTWKYFNDTESWVESHDLSVELKRPGRITCEVNCTIRHLYCNITPLTIIVLPQDDNNTYSAMIGLISGVAGLCLILSLICIVCIIRKKKRKMNLHGQEAAIPLSDNMDKGAVAGDIVLRIITSSVDKNHKNRVRGVTILNDELYLAFENCNIIEAVLINSLTKCRKLIVHGLMAPGTIAACARNNCLYVIDQATNSRKKIFRVKPGDGSVVNSWETDDDDRGRISVNGDGDVVMTVYDKGKVKIYSPAGKLLAERTIDLSGLDIKHIFHAINLTDGTFIIGHGTYQSNIHQVCQIDAKGKILQTFGNKKGCSHAELNCPAYLAEGKYGSILVADQDNHRIIELNSDLEFVRELFTKDNCNINRPEVMFVYEKNDPALLFLGCNETRNSGGYVLVLRLGE